MMLVGVWQSGCTPVDASRYGQVLDAGYTVSAVPLNQISREYVRQEIPYQSSYPPGTIIVDPSNYFLYLVQPRGRAIRYGVSVGKGAFGWSGRAVVGREAAWPKWTPPAEMVERSPDLRRYRGGLKAGAVNPLGARALYLFKNGRDTLYRIHGTPEWWSIGRSESSGCIRMLNHDVIDLAARVSVGAPVVVLPRKSIL
ncbi:L,D-transpeptidase [Jiella avicenniae]|nr:L,D-transpeptidase [Jiella avicenniae]